MENIALLYDEDCPLCRWYTKLFVKYKLLPVEGRIPFTVYTQTHPGIVDADLAQTKIACVNNRTNEVNYGIDSLLLVISQRFKWIQIVGNFKPIHYLLQLLYLFVSYNRKIVAPGPKKALDCACEPAKSVFWRVIFISVMSYFTYLIVHWYFISFLTDYLVENPVNDVLLLLAQIGFQWLAFTGFRQTNSYDYLGHLVFTSFLGALLLFFFGIGIQLLSFIGVQIDFLAAVCYGITVAFMFFEHKRRVALKEWSRKLSLNWVLFRICIYPLVFQL